MKTKIFLFYCSDQPGIVASIAQALFQHGGNIIEADQHSSCPNGGEFFLRIKFCYPSTPEKDQQMTEALKKVSTQFQATSHLYDQDHWLKTSILLSKDDHCLTELLYLWNNKELPIQIESIISNHDKHHKWAKQYNLPIHIVPSNGSDKGEKELLSLTQNTDFLILARYMQILSPQFLKQYQRKIINIHHSFLPSFKGANPYQQAFDRGVKVIGATAHFVTSDLDEGPIIAQMVEPVSHRHCVDNLKQTGRILEKHTLAKAIKLYAEHRIIPCANKTIVFT